MNFYKITLQKVADNYQNATATFFFTFFQFVRLFYFHRNLTLLLYSTRFLEFKFEYPKNRPNEHRYLKS
ncbi:hypothetical protein HanXRQr2_Chr10g0420311 [Helianthus annuus]|uniref:Uncharacterized protein n=1 Tax=Helianthus annuus TaxID=4232 RepID=A0A9K3HUR4_HELAN|nr:hypothetical protein HanXRQr2_Chr10g0420311 [Helianthus annuus]